MASAGKPQTDLKAEAGVKPFAKAFFPERFGLDNGSLGSNRRKPVPRGLSHELLSVVRPDVTRQAAQDEQLRQRARDG